MSPRSGRFAWLLNLDAELELAKPGYTPRARLLAQLEHYGAGARSLLGPSDVLIDYAATPPYGPDRAAPKAGESAKNDGPQLWGRAWCPTPRALAALRAAGAVPEPHPSVEVLRRVNHRHFAFELGGGLQDQRYFETRPPLEGLLRERGRHWLLKQPLAFAGRGQLRAFRALSAKEWSWIEASLKRDGLIVEPLVQPTLELSLHGFLWQSGRFELGRICVQQVSARAVFRAVRLAGAGEVQADEERALFLQGERVATALHEAGYFGPFGIDAYRYRFEQGTGFCALSEINARYTMGFATGFPRAASVLVLEE